MNDPITDSESMSEEPLSINGTEVKEAEEILDELGIGEDDDDGVTVTIVHHNGSEEVSGFSEIVEINVERSTLRVWYDENDYTDYYGATITKVEQ